MLNAQQMADRYKRAMQSADTVAKYKEGINSVTESPMAKAATPEAMDLYLRRVQESVSSGKRARKLMEAPITRYKNNALAKADRISSGAVAAMDKVQAHFQRFAPVYQQASDAAKSLPKGGFSEAQARWAASTQVMMAAAGRM